MSRILIPRDISYELLSDILDYVTENITKLEYNPFNASECIGNNDNTFYLNVPDDLALMIKLKFHI